MYRLLRTYALWLVPILLMSGSFVQVAEAVTLVKYVHVWWYENGEPKNWLYIDPGASITIQRDSGTKVDIRIFKTDAAPSQVEYFYTDFNNGRGEQRLSTQSYETFLDAVGPLNTQVWAGINTNEGRVEIFVNNIVPQNPDLMVSNIRVDGNSSPREYRVGEQVKVECIAWNNGNETATSYRLGYYIGTSSADLSNRWNYDSIVSHDPGVGLIEDEYYTFQESDIGTRYFVLFTDYRNDVDEGSNENNNQAFFGPFTVTPPPNQAPTITLTAPSSNITIAQGDIVTIAWTDDDPDDNASISLARDPDDNSTPWSTGEHTWITVSLHEDPEGDGDTYTWNTAGAPQGTYTIWALIYDGHDGHERYSRAVGRVTINQPGNLHVTVQNQDGISRPNAKVIRYTANWDPLDSKTTDVNGQVQWSDIPIGTYNLEAYYAGPTPFPDEEFWVNMLGVVVNTGSTTSTVLRRDRPFGSTVVLKNHATGQVLDPAAPIPSNTTVRAEVTVRNNFTSSQTVRVRVLLDRNRSSSYDFDQTSLPQMVASSDTSLFTFTYTPSEMGTYARAIKVETLVNTYTKTDSWDWADAFTVDNNTTITDQIWTTIQSASDNYEIHIISTGEISGLTSRPLQESVDLGIIKHIYILKNSTSIISGFDAVDLLLKVQSGKKFITLGADIRIDLVAAIWPDDLIEEHRTPPPELGSVYTAWAPAATNGWWRELAVYGGNGLDIERYRSERYADVLLDAILQPDIADDMDEQQELIQMLDLLTTFVVSPTLEHTIKVIRDARPTEVVQIGDVKTVVLNMKQISTNLKVAKYLDKLNLALETVNTLTGITGDAARYLFLQSLATAKAEERLEALKSWNTAHPQIDPALTNAVNITQSRFSSYLEREWYNQLGNILNEAVVGNVIEITDLTIKIGRYFNIVPAAIATVLKPYFLSWSTYKLIREQYYNAQHCVLAATLWKHLLESGRLQNLENRVCILFCVNGNSM